MKKSLILLLFGAIVVIGGSLLFFKNDFFKSSAALSDEKVTMTVAKEVTSISSDKEQKSEATMTAIKKEALSHPEVEATTTNEVVTENQTSNHKSEQTDKNIGKLASESTSRDHTNPPPVLNQATTEGQKYKLPVTPQLQQVWYYCAPTTVSMMLSARGIDVDQFQLAKEMGTYEPYGTHNVDAIRILNKYMFGTEQPTSTTGGYQLETVTQVDEATLTTFKQRVMKNIQDGYPMYYTFDVSKIYPGLEGEHNVIGNGYIATPDGNDVAYIYYIDPSPNVQDGTYGNLKILTPEELLNAMISCGEPNYAW